MIKSVKGMKPTIGKDCFIAETAEVLGDVEIGSECAVWNGAILRGDIASIKIGNRSNVQDNVVIHVSRGVNTVIGDDVTIAHQSTIHACTIGDNCLIGMGTIILDHAVIGKNTILGAASFVGNNKVIPEGVLAIGAPARVVRHLTEEEIQGIKGYSARNYHNAKENYLDDPELEKSWE